MKVPIAVSSIIKKLQSAGHQAYVVGGAVRDSLLGIEPNDWDVATSALPEDVVQLFPKTIPTGLKFGTVTVLQDMPIEVTTFRKEGRYLNGRKPQFIELGVTLLEDLARRDFTLNAIAYDPLAHAYIDPYGAKEELHSKKITIKTVGKPVQVFRDDALRLLRVFSLFAKLYPYVDSISIAPEVRNAIWVKASGLKLISAERIRAELNKIIISPIPKLCLTQMAELNLLHHIIPEICHKKGAKHYINAGCVEIMQHVNPDVVLRLAALLCQVARYQDKQDHESASCAHESAKLAQVILTRLKYSNEIITLVAHFIQNSAFTYPQDLPGVRKLIQKVGKEHIARLLKLKEAELRSQKDASFEQLSQLQGKVEHVMGAGDPLSIQDLKISGKDLITQLEIAPGPRIGKILNSLLEMVLLNPELNQRDKLLHAAHNFL